MCKLHNASIIVHKDLGGCLQQNQNVPGMLVKKMRNHNDAIAASPIFIIDPGLPLISNTGCRPSSIVLVGFQLQRFPHPSSQQERRNLKLRLIGARPQ